jgi:hypothetical protein
MALTIGILLIIKKQVLSFTFIIYRKSKRDLKENHGA